MEHTPTPWHTSHDDRGWAIVEGADIGNGTNLFLMSDWGHRNKKGKLDSLLTNEIAAANAEFIVRTVNSHDKLLEACKAVLMAIEQTDLNGAVMWIKPPFQAEGIHETAWERLFNVISEVEGESP